jgi:hypothetical protein
MDEYNRQNPEMTDPFKAINQIPTHLQSTFYPTSTGDAVDIEHGIGPNLIGTTIGLIDEKTGEVTKCTVQDFGTSHLQGDWVDVVYDDGRESRMLQKEMLANRVPL